MGEFVDRAVLGDTAAEDDGRLVGELDDLVEVVGGEDDRGAAVGQSADHAPQAAPHLRVEAGCGLVEEEELGASHDRHGDVEAAPLAAGQLAHAARGLAAEVDMIEGVLNRHRVLEEARSAGHRLADGEVAEVRGALGDDADARAPLAQGALRVLAEHADRPAVGAPQALEDLDGGGLARAVGAEQGEDGSGAHGQIKPAEHGCAAVGLRQAADLDDSALIHDSSIMAHRQRR